MLGGASFPATGAGAREWPSQPPATALAALWVTGEVRGAVVLKPIRNHVCQIRGSCQKRHIRVRVPQRARLASRSKSYLIDVLGTG